MTQTAVSSIRDLTGYQSTILVVLILHITSRRKYSNPLSIICLLIYITALLSARVCFFYELESCLMQSRHRENQLHHDHSLLWYAKPSVQQLPKSISGSGIALYAMIIFAGAYTVSIDRGTPTSHYYDGVVACCTVDIPPRSNVTVYSRTSLSIGNHILLLTMLDNQLGSGASYMYFDYAIVNSPNNAKPTISIKGTSSNDHSSTTSAANPPAKPRSR